MDEERVLAYVNAAAGAVGIPLDDAAARRVAAHLARTAAMAALLERMPLTESEELAEIYRPAPFPMRGSGDERL